MAVEHPIAAGVAVLAIALAALAIGVTTGFFPCADGFTAEVYAFLVVLAVIGAIGAYAIEDR
jgi:hypothetical protein